MQRPVKQATLAMRVLIPGTELRSLTLAERAQKPIHWIPGPPEDYTVSVEVVIADARLAFVEAGAPEMLARWELATGEAIWIGYRVAQTPDSINDVIADYRARGRTKLDGRRDWGAKHPQGRILIPFGPNKGGWRSFLDVASTTMGRGSIEMDPTAARRLGGT